MPKIIGIDMMRYIQCSSQLSASRVPASMTLEIEPMRAKPCAQETPVERMSVG